MERVREFDQEMRKIYENEYMGGEMVAIMCAVLGSLLVPFPFGGLKDDSGIPFYFTILLYIYSVAFYMKPYLVVEGKPIVQILKWMPVTKKEIYAVRMEYLNRRCAILFAIGLILHQIVPLCQHTFGIKSILEVVFVYFIVWLFGVAQIYLAK